MVQASNRSVSTSHVTSHARTNNPNPPARINIPTLTRLIRTSLMAPSPIRWPDPEDEPEEAQQFITLNSPKAAEHNMDPLDTFGEYKHDIQRAYEEVEEQEVVDLASPEKDDQDGSPSRQKEELYSTMGSSRPGRYQFVTNRQKRRSDIGSQFTPFYRPHGPTTYRIERLADEISGLRDDIKSSNERMERSSKNTNDNIDRLIAVMSQDR
jgi:hypothetical protein